MALPAATTPSAPDGFRFVTVSAKGSSGTVGMKIRVEGLKAVQNGLRELGVTDTPYLRKALENIGNVLAIAMEAVKPYSSYKVGRPRVLGKAPALRVSVGIEHPGARSMEFGRIYYYRGYTGRAMRATGYKIASEPGQKARPFLGIISGPSVVETIRPYAEPLIIAALQTEWERASRAMSNDVIEVPS